MQKTTPPIRWIDADLPLLRTLLAIRQMSREPSISEIMDFFILVVYAT